MEEKIFCIGPGNSSTFSVLSAISIKDSIGLINGFYLRYNLEHTVLKHLA